MTEKLLSQGKTVDQAVNSALQQLGKSLTDVKIDILEQPRYGFLGFKSKPAVVSVYVLDDVDSLPDAEDIKQEIEEKVEVNITSSDNSMSTDSLEGKAWVKNGELFCKDAPDRYPVVSPSEKVLLNKNGVWMTSPSVITEADNFSTKILNQEVSTSWNLFVSENKLTAYLEVKAGYHVTRTLKDTPPSNFIQLEVIETKTFTSIPYDDILSALEEKSIIHGIDYGFLSTLCSSGEDGTFVIANGTPPVAGTHGFFKPFDELNIKHQLKERLDGSVDYREVKEFPSVRHGQILGEVVSPVEGKAGLTVTGEIIPPESVYPVVLKLGTGVLLVDNTKVVAVSNGHSSVDVKGQLVHIFIVPKLTIPSDVSIETGNVHYSGAVEIRGSVQDGMVVEAQDGIFIGNNVIRAKIISSKSVLVRGSIISSAVTAGGNFLIKQSLIDQLSEISRLLMGLDSAIKQLSKVSAFKVSSLKVTGFGPLIKILCESKFKQLPSLIIAFSSRVDMYKASLEDDWVDLTEKLNRDFVTPHLSTIKSSDDIAQLCSSISKLSTLNEESTASVDFIKATGIQNSELFSSGDIIVSDQGVYNSKLRAKRDISIDGALKGGELHAGRNIYIDTIGDRVGYSMHITTSSTGVIKINQAPEDVRLKVGSEMTILTSRCKNVIAKLNSQGLLTLTKEEY